MALIFFTWPPQASHLVTSTLKTLGSILDQV